MKMMNEMEHCRTFLIESDGWIPLVESLNHENPDVREAAVYAVSCLSECELSHPKFVLGRVFPR